MERDCDQAPGLIRRKHRSSDAKQGDTKQGDENTLRDNETAPKPSLPNYYTQLNTKICP